MSLIYGCGFTDFGAHAPPRLLSPKDASPPAKPRQ